MDRDGYRAKIAYFDSQVTAPCSHRDYGEEERKKLERIFRYTGSLQGLTVLEPGCGTGRLTKILADRVGPTGRVVALDISPKMVEAARKRLTGRTQVEIILSAVEDLIWTGAIYNLILCHQVFPHFSDQGRALQHMAQGLKTGGKLVVFHFINLTQINDRHRKAGTAVGVDRLPPMEVMEDLFRKAGLKVDLFADDALGFFLGSVKLFPRLP